MPCHVLLPVCSQSAPACSLAEPTGCSMLHAPGSMLHAQVPSPSAIGTPACLPTSLPFLLKPGRRLAGQGAAVNEVTLASILPSISALRLLPRPNLPSSARFPILNPQLQRPTPITILFSCCSLASPPPPSPLCTFLVHRWCYLTNRHPSHACCPPTKPSPAGSTPRLLAQVFTSPDNNPYPHRPPSAALTTTLHSCCPTHL